MMSPTDTLGAQFGFYFPCCVLLLLGKSSCFSNNCSRHVSMCHVFKPFLAKYRGTAITQHTKNGPCSFAFPGVTFNFHWLVFPTGLSAANQKSNSHITHSQCHSKQIHRPCHCTSNPTEQNPNLTITLAKVILAFRLCTSACLNTCISYLQN